jgi:hypothetical protein
VNDFDAPVIPYLTDTRLLTRERHLVQEIAASRRRRQRHGFMLASAGLAAGGGATALVVLLGAGTSPAFAAWTASPTTPAPGQLAAATAACAARPANPPPGVPALPTKVTLADTRGPFSLLLFGTNTASSGVLMCMSGPDGTQFSIAAGSQPALPGTGQITLDRLQAGSANGEPYTIAEGSAGQGVDAITLALTDGSQVVTTVGNGLFLAWWPGTATVTSAAVTTSSGTTTQAISPPPRDTGGSGTASHSATNPGSGTAPHTAAQRAQLQRFCAQLKAEHIRRPNGQPIGPCAMLGHPAAGSAANSPAHASLSQRMTNVTVIRAAASRM